MTSTLHIEHQIHDFDMWKAAFARLSEARVRAGVLSHRVGRPVGDDHHVVIDLDFAQVDEAERFLAYLRTQVWTSTQTSPALAGEVTTSVLRRADI